jgi:hypothetical protein
MSSGRKRQAGLLLILRVKQLAFGDDGPGDQDQFASTSTQSPYGSKINLRKESAFQLEPGATEKTPRV